MKTFQSQFLISLYVILVCIAAIAFTSCSKDDEDTGIVLSDSEIAEFNAKMAGLSNFSQPSETPIKETSSTSPERDTQDPTLECSVKTYKGAPGFDEMFTLDPTTDVIYPGALLKGESIATGEYIGINADRKPMTVSMSLENILGKPSIVIQDPNKLSSAREAINKLLNQEVTGATPAEMTLSIDQVYSEEHLSAAIGVNYRGVSKEVSSNLDFNSSKYKNTFVLKFIQRYYSLDLDSPGSEPSDLFTNLPDVSSLGSTSPVYVSSITYGRMVLYMVESDSTMQKVRAAFAASAASIDGNIDIEYQTIINSSKIEALIIGGSGSGAVQAINGPADVYKFISEGGNYSKDSPGAPLAYKLRYVRKGFPVAKVILATEYQVRSCDLAYPEYQVTIEKITGTQPSDTEVYGYLRMKMKVGSSYLDANNNGIDDGPSWSKSRNNYVDVQNDKTANLNLNYAFKPYRPNKAIDQIEYFGELKDYNGIFPDKLLGNKSGEIKLDQLLTNQEQKFTLDFDNGITAHFKIARIK